MGGEEREGCEKGVGRWVGLKYDGGGGVVWSLQGETGRGVGIGSGGAEEASVAAVVVFVGLRWRMRFLILVF